MKEQLLKWGFKKKRGSNFYALFNNPVVITLRLVNDEINNANLFINGSIAPIPNCTAKLALFTFLYNLGLIEI